MSDYVIYLSTELDKSEKINDYGYWTGKTYVVEGEEYPSCESLKTHNTRIYARRGNAEKMAEKLLLRCSYVASYLIEKV